MKLDVKTKRRKGFAHGVGKITITAEIAVDETILQMLANSIENGIGKRGVSGAVREAVGITNDQVNAFHARRFLT